MIHISFEIDCVNNSYCWEAFWVCSFKVKKVEAELVRMEYIVEELELGRLRLALSILEKQGYRIFITARDSENRRLWKTPLMDGDGHIKVFQDTAEALMEVKNKLFKSHNS